MERKKDCDSGCTPSVVTSNINMEQTITNFLQQREHLLMYFFSPIVFYTDPTIYTLFLPSSVLSNTFTSSKDEDSYFVHG